MKFRSFYLSLKIIFRIFLKNIELVSVVVIGFSFFAMLSMLKGNYLLYDHFKIQSLNKNSYPLRFEDIKSLKASSIPIKSISSEESFVGVITNRFDNINCEIIGGGEGYKNFLSTELLFGRFFSEYEHLKKENVILIDNLTSLKMFGTQNSVGREVFLENPYKRVKYKVIGVFKKEKFENLLGECIIPIENFLKEFKKEPFFEYICISVHRNQTFKTSTKVIDFLKVKNNISKDVYRVIDNNKNPLFRKGIFEVFEFLLMLLNLITFKKLILSILEEKNFKNIFSLCFLSSLLLGIISVCFSIIIFYAFKSLGVFYIYPLGVLNAMSVFVFGGFITFFIYTLKLKKRFKV